VSAGLYIRRDCVDCVGCADEVDDGNGAGCPDGNSAASSSDDGFASGLELSEASGLSNGVDGRHVSKVLPLLELLVSFFHMSALGAASSIDMLLSLPMLLLESSFESSAG